MKKQSKPAAKPGATKAVTTTQVNIPSNGHSLTKPEAVPMQRYQPEDNGLSFEEDRRQYLQTCPPHNFQSMPRSALRSKCTDYAREKWIFDDSHTMSRLRTRDATTGVYPGASEAFHRQVEAKATHAHNRDIVAADLLITGQPYRHAMNFTDDGKQPLSTYGPMQLPESYDPVNVLTSEPEPEPRPTHWEPGTPPAEVVSGTIHDFGNYLSALVARQVVAMGFAPDSESIANARSLARTIKDFQKIIQVDEERRAAKPRKTSPGRPPKRTFLSPEKALTLRLEIVERNKKFKNKKYADITLEDSAPEADLNTETPELEKTSATPAESEPEADLNLTAPEHPADESESPAHDRTCDTTTNASGCTRNPANNQRETS